MVQGVILWASAATLVAAPAWTEDVIFGPGRLHKQVAILVQGRTPWASTATLVAAPARTEDLIFGPGRLHSKRPLWFRE